MQILGTVLNVFFIIICILLILLILMQSGRSSGIGLFGGSGSQTAFGAGSADVLTKTTAILVVLFMVTGLGMAFMRSNETNVSKIQEKFTEKPELEDTVNTDAPVDNTQAPATVPLQTPEANQPANP